MPECAPDRTHTGQESRREAGSRAKTGLEEPHRQRFPVTCLAMAAKRALCSPSLALRENTTVPEGIPALTGTTIPPNPGPFPAVEGGRPVPASWETWSATPHYAP